MSAAQPFGALGTNAKQIAEGGSDVLVEIVLEVAVVVGHEPQCAGHNVRIASVMLASSPPQNTESTPHFGGSGSSLPGHESLGVAVVPEVKVCVGPFVVLVLDVVGTQTRHVDLQASRMTLEVSQLGASSAHPTGSDSPLQGSAVDVAVVTEVFVVVLVLEVAEVTLDVVVWLVCVDSVSVVMVTDVTVPVVSVVVVTVEVGVEVAVVSELQKLIKSKQQSSVSTHRGSQ